MKRDSVVVAGYFGFGNAGDELILRAMIDSIYKEIGNARVIVFSRHPQETQLHLGVEAVDRWKPWQWIPAFLSARRFILGGGGLLQESTGSLNHIYYLSLVILAKLLGARTEVRAIGVDPVQRQFNRWLTSIVFNHFVDYVSVRDTDSQRSLETTGVRRPVLRTADPVFQLTIEKRKSEDCMAFAISPWARRPGWDQDLALFFKRLVTHLHVSIDILAFYPAEDEDLAQRVAQLAGMNVRYRSWSKPEELLTFISDYALVVGMRYHALALAALAEKPFIGWGYQRKVRSLCREFGQPLWTFERGWESDAVYRQISETWRQRDILPHRYQENLPEMKSPIPMLKDVPRIFPSQV